MREIVKETVLVPTAREGYEKCKDNIMRHNGINMS